MAYSSTSPTSGYNSQYLWAGMYLRAKSLPARNLPDYLTSPPRCLGTGPLFLASTVSAMHRNAYI